MANALTVIGGVAAGLGLMYFLDPDEGRRRRALARDQMVHAAHRTGDAMDATSRDLANRARGAVAELRGRLGNGEVGDDVLHERVRARVASVLGRSGGVEVSANEGRVVLGGPILAHEVDRLVRRVAAVRGVRSVDNHLEVHDEPGTIPGLQGAERVPRGGEVFDLMERRWPPSARFVSGAAGLGLALWGLRRLDGIGIATATLGAGLVARALRTAGFGEIEGAESARRVRSRALRPRARTDA